MKQGIVQASRSVEPSGLLPFNLGSAAAVAAAVDSRLRAIAVTTSATATVN
jgi:hypothetical protein